ncbi:MAG: CapA family protein [Pseudomonadota bacterium]
MSHTPSPYSARETVGLLWRNLAGPSRANPAGQAFLPQQAVFNDIEPAITVGFAGDIMMMFNRKLAFGAGLRHFFADCDHVLANLEGVITDLPKRGPDQKHTPDIIDALATLAAPERMLLSVANNHCGDFGATACRDSMAMFADRGFHLFGMAETPYADPAPQLRVVTGTQWSNRGGDHLAWLENPERHVRPGAVNILFPHWGHEMLCYPRAGLHAQARHWLEHFDAIIGHHSHTPQPVSAVPTAQGSKPVAWSLGDFCFGLGYRHWPALKHYPWGIVVKMRLGPRRNGSHAGWAVGELQWRFTDCAPQPSGQGFVTGIVDRIPYFPAPA